MTKRTSKRTVTFRRPFVLGGFGEVLPAGDYAVETDEELLDGISFPAYRRILALIHLHPKPGHPGRKQTLAIDPNKLDAALKRDRAPECIPIDRDASQKTLENITGSRQDAADREAMDQAENEGMIVHPG